MMNSSTRLYERLGQIPQDPADPESLDDLLVCAFGAFERYYVCWKNKAGEYRQDGYDLPSALQEWLFPADGSTRDFATLQVVFGRGDEYFASDKNGKLEYKEPEVKKPPPPPPKDDEDIEKPSLRRARTVSFLRPLSDSNQKPVTTAVESPSSSRRSSASSQQPSRPPSMSLSRTMSDLSLSSQPASRPPSTTFSRPNSESSFISQTTTTSTTPSIPPSDPENKPAESVTDTPTRETAVSSPVSAPTRLVRRSRPLSMSFSGSFPKIEEGKQYSSGRASPPKDVSGPSHCTCGCHDPPLSTQRKPVYADASIQTDPITPPPRTALRIDTSDISSFPSYSNNSSAQEIQTPPNEVFPEANPVYMGRMLDYFSKPGYQLGDSLMSSYYYYQQPVYQYQDEFEVEEAWARDGE